MISLNNLSPLCKKRKRIGRGGSRGGTSGRGHQGQGSRSGGSVGVLYEGGQMPLARRLPKRGFNNAAFKQKFEIVNLSHLNDSFENDAQVTKETLIEKGVIKGKRGYLLKILGNGALEKKLMVYADAFSDHAAETIKKQGGEVFVNKEM